MELFIAALAGAIGGSGIVWLLMTIQKQAEQIKKLQETQARHLPYSTAEHIEDLIATLNSEAFKAEFRIDLINNALAHAYMARRGNGHKKG